MLGAPGTIFSKHCVCVCVSWYLPVSCQYLPVTAVNTTVQLIALRQQMLTWNLSAYIVPDTDAHMSEYIGKRDERRAWMTGFTGSAGDTPYLTPIISVGRPRAGLRGPAVAGSQQPGP